MAKNAIITGAYDTRVGSLPDSTCMSLHTEAGMGAIRDAGLTTTDIDGLLTAYSFTSPQLMLGAVFAEYVGMQPKVSASISMGGATAGLLLHHAVALVESGICRHVLCLTADNRLTGLGDRLQQVMAGIGHEQYEQPYGMSVPAVFAQAATLCMEKHGLTKEGMAAVAVNQRNNAIKHPNAHMKKTITRDDVLNSKMIASPLQLLDCCPVSDGGAAVVVSAAETAGDSPKAKIEILGIGEGHTHEHIMMSPSLVDFGCKESAATALGKAGVTHSDIDTAHIYDCFSSTLLICLESMGFYERGAASQAAVDGHFAIDGSFPLNTNGGLLSYGSSGAAGGMFHITEAVKQLRGECGDRQVKAPELAFTNTLGGIFSSHCSMVLGRS